LRVIVGGWTRSMPASSPTVSSPYRNKAPSTAITGMLRSLAGSRSLASLRRNRITDTRSSDAKPASVRETFSTLGIPLA